MFTKAIVALLPLLSLGVTAAPAPVPSGGVGARMNDTPPVYAVMSDCEYNVHNRSLDRTLISQSTTNRSSSV